MGKYFKVLAAFAVAAGAAGCLQKETRHSLYLSPDGAVRWVIDESGVYSDDSDVGARVAEEQGYIGPALIGAHRAAQALQAIAPDGLVRTTIVRDERPFHVITDARFGRVDRMFDRLFRENGITTTSSLTQDGNRTSLRIHFDFRREMQERPSPAAALLEEIDEIRFVLAEGEFVAGPDIELVDRTRARISGDWFARAGAAVEAKAETDLVVTWSSSPSSRP